MIEEPSFLATVLACPHCKGKVDEAGDGIRCSRCGPVGRRTLGIMDFTPLDGKLPSAAGATFDLEDDRRLAEHLLDGERTYAALFAEATRAKAWTAADDDERSRQVVRRAEARYNRVEVEAGDRHGSAILDKAGAIVEEGGGSLPSAGLALEAGGGFGKYVEGFRQRFDGVVFVDCSLTNIVLARRLATEQGIDGVAFLRGDVTALPLRSGAFAFVHQNGVIEHVHDPVAMVRESRRVAGSDGIYTCLSPNRYPITREPHFEMRLYGIYPWPLRRWLMRRARGVDSDAGTDLRSLRDLRRAFEAAGAPDADPVFLPPRLPSIARRTPVRRAVQRALDHRVVRRAVLAIVNGPLLPIMPYHLVVVRGS